MQEDPAFIQRMKMVRPQDMVRGVVQSRGFYDLGLDDARLIALWKERPVGLKEEGT